MTQLLRFQNLVQISIIHQFCEPFLEIRCLANERLAVNNTESRLQEILHYRRSPEFHRYGTPGSRPNQQPCEYPDHFSNIISQIHGRFRALRVTVLSFQGISSFLLHCTRRVWSGGRVITAPTAFSVLIFNSFHPLQQDNFYSTLIPENTDVTTSSIQISKVPSEPRVSPTSKSDQQSLVRKTEESVNVFGSTNFIIHCIDKFQWSSHCQKCPNSRPFPESPKYYKLRHHDYYQRWKFKVQGAHAHRNSCRIKQASRRPREKIPD
ncbi:hypothetical protein AVEN_158900-1 [Araneus ventricosus]|uniref:Uncharacterized protein n=1 Tax=Araneus ventricosus TaxID=182803 RepID=A0A4Y2BAH1_ARAVE|nr:hypothetical protein AVEN_158900-1 [Araneus ventricosus]